MSDLCVTLGGQPLYYMCDCFYLRGQTGGNESTIVSRTFIFALLDSEPLSRLVTGDLAICADHFFMWLIRQS